MNFEGTENFGIPDFNQEATMENITQLAQVLVKVNKIDGKKWENLRESLYQFCLKELERVELGDPYSLGEFVPKIEGFYQGYMACSNYCRNPKKF